jgi:hypothetical protein
MYMDSFISSLLYPQFHKPGACSIMSLGTSIRHTLGVHISNSLLLLHQLMDFNETFRDIFLTQCGDAPPIFIFQMDFGGVS